MNILITGGAGFIGSHISDKLINQNVIIVDNLSTGNYFNVNKHCKFYLRDIKSNLEDIFQKENINIVIHTAAFISVRDSFKNPAECFETNVQASINLIELCKKYNVSNFIFSSTGGAIYDENQELPLKETSKTNPLSPYGLSKLTIENYLKISGLNYTILRYSNVYGPRQNSKSEAGVISIFIEKIKQNNKLSIFGDGNQTRDFVYVDDVVNANLMFLKNPQNDIFNVSTNKKTSINEIINLFNYKNIEYLPKIDNEILHSQLSYEKINKLGWNPKITIEEGFELLRR